MNFWILYGWFFIFINCAYVHGEDNSSSNSTALSSENCKYFCRLRSKCSAYLNFHNISLDSQNAPHLENGNICCPGDNEEANITSSLFTDCQETDELKIRYTYGGQETLEGDFPYLALLHFYHPNKGDSFPCSGALVSDLFILTAAHCVTGAVTIQNGKLINIRLDEYDLTKTICKDGKCNSGAVEIGIGEIIVHKDYDEKRKLHDIALVRLEKSIKHLQPACLRWERESSDTKIGPGHNFTIVGWGRTLLARRASISNTLEIPFYDHEECARKYAKLNFTITDSQICAGGIFKKDTCDGDSGGPLITKDNDCEYIDGIVSFGKGCGLENWPGIYVNVMSYKDWIIEHMKPNSETDIETNTETKTEIEINTQPNTETKTEIETNAETKSEIETGTKFL